MAGDALSFAEVLRDEFRVLHGRFPDTYQAKVEAKHLREVEYLEHKAHTSSAPRYQLYCSELKKTSANLDRDERAADAFTNLLHQEELFQKLLSDREVAAALRNPKTLRRLIQVPHARAVVFRDPAAAALIIKNASLFDVFVAESAAVRVLVHTEGGREMFARYPALLATLADNEQLSVALTEDRGAATRRADLVYTFGGSTRAHWWQFWFTPEPADEALKAASRSPREVASLIGLNPETIEVAEGIEQRTILNALLLETAFPDCFTDSYDVRAMNRAQHEENLAALCLSGGGIRSATFNLGILQGLADHRLLTKFHYLSTVSGGGYIGSWLSSWMRRHTEGLPGVADDLSAAPADPEEPEVRPIQHLREYSSYLAPRAAAFSTDAWTIIATYVRNLLLNWTMLIPAMLVVLAVPRLVESAAYAAFRGASFRYYFWPSTYATGTQVMRFAEWTALLCGAMAVIAIAMLRPIDKKRSGNAVADDQIRTRRKLNWLWLAPMLLSASAFCVFWAGVGQDGVEINNTFPLLIGSGTAVAGLIYVLRRIRDARTLTWAITRRGTWEILAAGIAGAAAGWLIQTAFGTLFRPSDLGENGSLNFEYFICFGPALFLFIFFLESALLVGLTTLITSDDAREWWARSAALTFVNAFFYVALTSVVVLLPLAIAQSPKIIASVGGVSAVAFWLLGRAEMLKPRGEERKRSSAIQAMALKVVATLTLALILGALSLLTSALLEENHANEISAPSELFGVHSSAAAKHHLAVLHGAPLVALAAFMLIAGIVAAVMSLFLNVNIYSMHGMYRNRLIRAYLGASRWFRRPDPFTGFDPHDNLSMFELRSHALWSSDFVYLNGFAKKLVGMPWFRHLQGDVQKRVQTFVAAGPNSPAAEVASELARALNRIMVERDLANDLPAPRCVALFIKNREYLEREFATLIRPLGDHEEPHDRRLTPTQSRVSPHESRHVVFADESTKITTETKRRRRPPLHIMNTTLNLVGGDNLAWQERQADSFTISPLHSGNRRLGYRDSFDYGEQISLGTAMAISGAAVSPNMGYNSSPVVTFLMTLFNARLGWWLGNPSRAKFDKPGPTMTLNSIFDEALGKTNDSSDYVFLSDGGHFDNLGLYEMVRRRCRYIVACDATADAKYAFSDLGNAVRKIRVDTGIPITLSTTFLPPSPTQKYGLYCALGLIHYGNVDCNLAAQPGHPHRFGYLLYIKPAVYSECPPDVRNYKTEHDTFPHESTIDQFFSESQFESYRALGRHIVGQMCGDAIDQPSNIAASVATFIGWSKNYIDEQKKKVDEKQVPGPTHIVDWVQASVQT